MSDNGIVLALNRGKRSSSRVGREVVAEALSQADPIGAGAALRETAWRQNYPAHLRRLVEAGLPGESRAVQIAERGLSELRRQLAYRSGGKDLAVGQAFHRPTTTPLTETVAGRGPAETEFTLPYRGRRLRGAEVAHQLDQWVDHQVLEPSAAGAINTVLAHPEWLSLADRPVVVLGASAELGPLHSLLRWGAHFYAVDLPVPHIWRNLTQLAREHAGVLHYPVTNSRPGADLLTDLGSVAAWLGTINSTITLGNYVYADGVLNLRLAAAVDLLTEHHCAKRPDTSLAALATATDVFAVGADVVEAATQAYQRERLARWLRPTVRTLSAGKLLRPNYAPNQVPGINDSVWKCSLRPRVPP